MWNVFVIFVHMYWSRVGRMCVAYTINKMDCAIVTNVQFIELTKLLLLFSEPLLDDASSLYTSSCVGTFLFFVSIVFNSFISFSLRVLRHSCHHHIDALLRFVYIILSRWMIFYVQDGENKRKKIPNLWFYLSYDYVLAICFTFSDFILCWCKEIKMKTERKKNNNESSTNAEERRTHNIYI